METWGWVGTISPIEEEASSSSQFQSSISTSGYSGVFTWGSSRLRPRLVAGSSFTLSAGTTDNLGGWSASSSSQFQSSISTSGYSGVFTWGSSRLRPRLVAGEYNYSQQQYYVHLNVWIYYRCITSILLNNNTMYPYFGDYTVDELL